MSKICHFAASGTEAVFAYYESGDENLLTPVLTELRQSLDCYAEQKLGLYDEGRREDLVQESLVAILRELRGQKFRGAVGNHGDRVGILSWAKQVCRYRFLDGLDSKKGQPSEPGRDENPFRTLSSLSEDNQAETLSYLPQAEAVLTTTTEAVLALDPKLRQVLILVYFRSLSHHQAADQLGLDLSALRARLDTALGQLRTWAARQQVRPTDETYRALRHLDTGDLFQEADCEPLLLAS